MSVPHDPYAALERELQGVSPYPGLRPFLPEEARFFRGRAAQIEEIGQRLAAQGCVAVLGGSGSGKSSIVRAGVVPALRRKLIPERGDLWRIAIFTPGLAPIDNLVAALLGTLRSGASQETSTAEANTAVRATLFGPDGLGGFLSVFRDRLDIDPGVSAQAQGRANLFVLIDQFEELFRDANRGKRQTAALIELVVDFWRRRSEQTGLYLALTMRTDDLHRCAEFIDLPDLINATSYLTRRLTEAELRDAIVAPVRPPLFRAGLLDGTLAPGAVDLRPYEVQVVTELLDATEEIAHDPDHLPLLQHLLAVLWRHTRSRWQAEFADATAGALPPQVTREDLARALRFAGWADLSAARARATGARASGWILKHCLEQVAEDLYAGDGFGPRLTATQQELARIAFCLMGEVDDRGNFKRRWTNETEIALVAGRSGPGPDTQAVVRRFGRDHRLLWVRDNGDIDVSHEALMRNWPRLIRWLTHDRDAAAAHLRLGEAAARWEQANGGRAPWLWWLSWFRRRDGLLGSESLERIEPLLVRRSHRWSPPQPRYTSAWTGRYLSAGNAVSTPPPAALDDGLESAYRQHLRYLRLSILRERVRGAVPAGVVGVLLLTTGITVMAWHHATERGKQLEVSLLWRELGGFGPINSPEQIASLWTLALAKPATRREFIEQMSDDNNLRQLGFRGKPIVRALGLTWPEQSEEFVSKEFGKRLDETDQVENPWIEASLACATTALSDRLECGSHKRAVVRFQKVLAKQTDPRDLRLKGRILSCLDPRLSPEESSKECPKESLRLNAATVNSAVRAILEAVSLALTAARPGGFGNELRDLTPAAAVVIWAARADSGLLTDDDRGLLGKFANMAIDQLREPANDVGVVSSARALVSLIAALPPDTQRAALKQTITVANGWQKPVNPVLLLILAQAFEVVARQDQANGTSAALAPLVAQAAELVRASDGAADAAPVGQLAVVRLALPLAEVAGGGAQLIAAFESLGPDSLDLTATDLPDGWGDDMNTRHLLLGVKARALALQATTGATTAPLPILEDLLQILQRLGGGAIPAPGRPAAPTATPGDASPGPDRAGTTGFETFAREALAQLIAALAHDSKAVTDSARTSAVRAAKAALAKTASAEEAAAWTRALVALLDPIDDDQDYVIEVAEILKYPNAGLSAREPNADEPADATDILIKALAERPGVRPLLEPGDLDPRPGNHRRVLEKIARAPQFADLDLDAVPRDPRPPPAHARHN